MLTFCDLGCDGVLSLPQNLQSIESSAFMNCKFKCPLNLPDSLIEIENSAFYKASFTGDLILPKKLETIDYSVFLLLSRIRWIFDN